MASNPHLSNVSERATIPKALIVVLVVAAVVLAAVLVVSILSVLSAVSYYRTVTYVTAPNVPIVIPEVDKRAAKLVEVPAEVVREIVGRAGVGGKPIGTYRYNKTHYVTLVEVDFLKIYAVIWRDRDLAVYPLKFEVFMEGSRRARERIGAYEFVEEWKYVGYVDISGVLPFAVFQFRDVISVRYYTGGGHYEVVVEGFFTIIHGTAVYVRDVSRSVVTDPTLRECFFRNETRSDLFFANIIVHGRAVTTNCTAGGAEFNIEISLIRDAWLYHFPDVDGSVLPSYDCRCRDS